jgi:hypothetical protein
VKNIRAHREVQVRVSGKSFAAHARILSPADTHDGALLRAIQDMTRAKYGWGEGTVVELVPVSGQNRTT